MFSVGQYQLRVLIINIVHDRRIIRIFKGQTYWFLIVLKQRTLLRILQDRAPGLPTFYMPHGQVHNLTRGLRCNIEGRKQGSMEYDIKNVITYYRK
jgi:hypothetical protein